MYILACAARYLRARPITWVSIAGVALGVAALVAILAIMEGFQRDLRGRFRGTMAEIIVRPTGDAPVADLVARAAAVTGVAGVAPRAHTAGILRTGGAVYPVEILAVDPDLEPAAADYGRYVARTILADTAQGARNVVRTLGFESTASRAPQAAVERLTRLQSALAAATLPAMAMALDAAATDLRRLWPEELGETKAVQLARLAGRCRVAQGDADAARQRLPLPADTRPALPAILGEELRLHLWMAAREVGAGPERLELLTAREARPGEKAQAGLVEQRTPIVFDEAFRSGRLETDLQGMLVSLAGAWKRGLVPDGRISELAVRAADGQRLDDVAVRLRTAFPGAIVETWEARQGALLRAVKLEKAFWALILFMVVVVAGFVMLATFLMMVAQKTRDLGILRALGASAAGVASIFGGSAALIGVIGTALGLAAGLAFSGNANAIFAFLDRFRLSPFPPDVYYMEGVPVAVELDVAWQIAVATVAASVLLGGVLPALRAARLDPIRALRHE